jgi:2-oxo-4-hydroxy-4-carboxy-5-ureidoimidazoline decarboxylase
MMPEAKLAGWNAQSIEDATAELLPCNGSRAWASELARQRPFTTVGAVLKAADEVWWNLPETDWQEAFDSHPRIGERHAKAASATSLQWSVGEQSGVSEEDAVKAALAEGNQAYEKRFGRLFLVCATGKSAAEMLAILRARLGNTPEAELQQAAEQQRRITQLRLRKWLGTAPARCEDV